MVDRIRTEIRRVMSGESGDGRMSQAELDAYRRQLVLLAISVTAILLIVILGAGAYYQYVHLPRQTVAVVDGDDIRRSEYWTFRRYDLLNQIGQYQQFAQFAGEEQQQQYQQLAFQASQEFEDVENASIDPVALNEMTENKIIMDALDEFGIEITDQDVEDFLVTYFTGMQLPGEDDGPTADPTAEAWATATAEAMQQEAEEARQEAEADADDEPADDAADDSDDTEAQDDDEAEPEPTPEPTPSEAEIRATATATQGQHEQNFLDLAEMSHDDFVEIVVKPQIAREKIRERLGSEVPTRDEQVRASHILVATEEAARLIHEELVGDDPRDFADAAEAQSTDTQTAPNGGDLGWFPRGLMVPEFDDVVFETQVDEISEPFQTEFGWHIVTVVERDDDRPIELNVLSSLRQRAFQDWLDERRASAEIDSRGVTLPDDPGAPPATQFQPPPAAPQPPQPTPAPMPDQPDVPEPIDDEDFDDLFPDGDPFEDLDDN